ncbi:sensor domain-containing diguanylate cyclase [Arabiibacter massiliensis]|uniref:sensor domain-containing diguanylate cyclase n=1 Tax=Arabiibacter massiliensis TaxID=1870985 RepID=UPI0018D888D6|nr:sensor domain-containing diguanylate cyclase [Arabiibacter massiliensis]
MRTNVLICLVVIGGFAITSLLSYQANYGASIESIEQVSRLASESIYYRLSAEFAKPVNISLTMANDSLLESLLLEEPARRDDAAYIETIREYLASYRDQYGYDSVFLVSTATGRYYNFEGIDRVLERGDPENDWYFALLEGGEEHAMNVDNDEAAHDEITVFVNCKIHSGDEVLGVIGVGMRVEHLQGLFLNYREEFGVDAYLVDDSGVVEVSTEHNGHEGIDYFSLHPFTSGQRDDVLDRDAADNSGGFWAEKDVEGGVASSFVVSRYVSDLGWHLVVERDTGSTIAELRAQLVRTVLVITAIVAVILIIITSVIRGFNRRIVNLTQSVERERRTAFEKATDQMFDGIYELDVTHDRPANQAAEDYFESLGAPRGLPFSSSLHIVAEKQIKEEFRQGYLDMFSPESVLAAFAEGRDVLSYECMISSGGDYYWMRITARLVQNDADDSVRMLVYRQNIDAEKRQENRLQHLAMTDEMTGLYTKSATMHLIERRLAERPDETCAFFIFDIDVFKQANDRFGHVFGDSVIESFTGTIRSSFRKDDIIGRVGGDEFVAFVTVPSDTWAKRKAEVLSRALDHDHTEGDATWHVSASIGIALAPRDGRDFKTLYKHADEALYRTKDRGRNGYTLYGDA